MKRSSNAHFARSAEDGAVLCEFEVILTESDQMFPYTVSELLILSES